MRCRLCPNRVFPVNKRKGFLNDGYCKDCLELFDFNLKSLIPYEEKMPRKTFKQLGCKRIQVEIR